jgi:hypothetical protein
MDRQNANMNLIEQFRSEHPHENRIWRFFSDSDHQWRWERLAFDGTVLEHSESGYPQYESCMANAGDKGYVFLASLSSTKPKSTSPKKKRSYTLLTTKHRKQVAKCAPRESLNKSPELLSEVRIDTRRGER